MSGEKVIYDPEDFFCQKNNIKKNIYPSELRIGLELEIAYNYVQWVSYYVSFWGKVERLGDFVEEGFSAFYLFTPGGYSSVYRVFCLDFHFHLPV